MFGDRGEDAAVAALRAAGLTVVVRNARTRFGEIDLILRERRGYVFAEVKTRAAASFVSARESMSRRKQARLERLAWAWLAERGERDAAWRLELVAVTADGGALRIERIPVDRAAR